MFDIGFPELVLVFIIGLIVLGPQRLPKVAAEIGKWVGRARRTATQLRRQLEREIELSELAPTQPPPPTTPSSTPPVPPEAKTPSPDAADVPPEPTIKVPADEGEAVSELYGGARAPSGVPPPERSDEPSKP